LNPDTHIYRFIDFFALSGTIRNRQLRFAAPSTFPDKNEGLEIFYNSLRAAVESNDGSYSGITSQEDIRRTHNGLKQTAFVSSWTCDADSVALWSLYSADKCGVRISSTASKLQAALDDFAHRNCLQAQFERYGLTDGSSYVFVQGVAVKEALYEDLRSMHEDILTKGPSQQILTDQKRTENFEFLTLKDKAFIHEGEIRGIVICGLAAPSESKAPFTDSAPWLDGDHVYVDIPDDFVESVAIDPRCPRYKREIIEGYLRDHNISIALSRAFGYLPDELDFVAPNTPPSK
jgi:hypothetical protein